MSGEELESITLECKIKAAMFMLALISGMLNTGALNNSFMTSLTEAYCCLTSSCAWQHSLPDAIARYNQTKATHVQTLSFKASLQFWELEWLPTESPELSIEIEEVGCTTESCIKCFRSIYN